MTEDNQAPTHVERHTTELITRLKKCAASYIVEATDLNDHDAGNVLVSAFSTELASAVASFAWLKVSDRHPEGFDSGMAYDSSCALHLHLMGAMPTSLFHHIEQIGKQMQKVQAMFEKKAGKPNEH